MHAATEECREYHQPRMAELDRLLDKAQGQIGDLCVIVGDIEQCRCIEGDSVQILCDNPEADESDKVAAVEACGDYTGHEPQRFYGATWSDALHKAANCARNHYCENDENDWQSDEPSI